MFTGIVTDIGEVVSVEQSGDTRIGIKTAFDTSTIEFGASIACSGCCLTVVAKGDDWFSVDVSDEVGPLALEHIRSSRASEHEK